VGALSEKFIVLVPWEVCIKRDNLGVCFETFNWAFRV